MVLVVLAIMWIAPIFVGHQIGRKKGRTGWAWGLLLGWIGVIIVACLGPAGKHAEVEKLEAEVRLAELRLRQAELQRRGAQ